MLAGVRKPSASACLFLASHGHFLTTPDKGELAIAEGNWQRMGEGLQGGGMAEWLPAYQHQAADSFSFPLSRSCMFLRDYNRRHSHVSRCAPTSGGQGAGGNELFSLSLLPAVFRESAVQWPVVTSGRRAGSFQPDVSSIVMFWRCSRPLVRGDSREMTNLITSCVSSPRVAAVSISFESKS